MAGRARKLRRAGMMPWFCNTAGRVGARMHANAFGNRSSSLIFPETESRHEPSECAANVAHRCGTVKAGMSGFEAAFASVINNAYVTDFTHHHAYQPRKAAAFQYLAAKRLSVFITDSCRVIDILLTISPTCKSTEIAFFRLFWQVPSRKDVCPHVPLWPTACLAGFAAGSKPKGRGPADPRTCRHIPRRRSTPGPGGGKAGIGHAVSGLFPRPACGFWPRCPAG